MIETFTEPRSFSYNSSLIEKKIDCIIELLCNPSTLITNEKRSELRKIINCNTLVELENFRQSSVITDILSWSLTQL